MLIAFSPYLRHSCDKRAKKKVSAQTHCHSIVRLFYRNKKKGHRSYGLEQMCYPHHAIVNNNLV